MKAARFLLAALLLLAGIAHAQIVPSAAADVTFGRFMSTVVGAGQTTVSFGSSGSPLAAPSAATLATDGAASLSVARTAQMLNPSGNPLTVTGTARVLGAALGPFIRNAMLLEASFATGYAIGDLARELWFKPVKNADGSVTLTRTDPSLCYTSPCYSFSMGSGATNSGPQPTQLAACQRNAQLGSSTDATYNYVSLGYRLDTTNPPGGWCQMDIRYKSNGTCYLCNYEAPYQFVPAPAASPNYQPATLDDLANAIASKSGWPSTSQLPKAVARAIELQPTTQVQTEPAKVTGPATSTGTTTTTNKPDGTKDVTTVTHNHTYNNGNVTTTTTTVINNYNTTNNITGTTTSTSTAPRAADPAPDPKTDCDKYPDSVGCAKLGDTPTSDQLNKKTSAVNVVPVSFAAGSACPQPLGFSVRGTAYTVSYQPLCDKLAVLKFLFLAMAGFIAALILADSFKV